MTVFGVQDFDDDLGPAGEFTGVGLMALLNGRLAENWISDWNQGDRDDVGEGICMGMCLDWIRRILTGLSRARLAEKKSAIASTSKFSAVKDKYRWSEQIKTNQILRQSQSRRVGEQRYAREVAAALGRIRLIDVEFANVQTIDQAEHVANEGPSGPLDMVRWNRMSEGLAHELDAMRVALQAPVDPRDMHRLRLQGQAEIFDALAARDAELIPGISIFKKTRTHSFSRLQVVGTSHDTVQNPLTEYNFLRFAQLRLVGLDGDSCGILSMGRFGHAGHDVAFYAAANRAYFCYLDPNLGELYFGATQWTELGLTLAASWRALYGNRQYDWLSWTTYKSRT